MTQDSGSDGLNLQAYFQRIGYSGVPTPAPTLETLRTLHLAHTRAIAFENLNSFLKQPVLLDSHSLQQKLVYGGRGGYCFEQNSLLRLALEQIGFQVTNLAARVLWNVPPGVVTPRSHMVLRVEAEGNAYLADVGFGGITLTTPLALIPGLEQQTSHEPFRLISNGPVLTLQVLLKQEWNSLYYFDLQEQQLPDYEVSNWYVSTHPNSLFVTTLIVARPGEGCRYALRNRTFTTHYFQGETVQRNLTSVEDLRQVLEEVFKLNLSAIAPLDHSFQRWLTD